MTLHTFGISLTPSACIPYTACVSLFMNFPLILAFFFTLKFVRLGKKFNLSADTIQFCLIVICSRIVI